MVKLPEGLQDGLQEWVGRPPFDWHASTTVQASHIDSALQLLKHRHHLDGAVVPGPKPLVFFRMLPGVAPKDVSLPLAWGWDTDFGGVFSLTSIAGRGRHVRVSVPAEDPAFSSFEQGSVTCVLLDGSRVVGVRDLDFFSGPNAVAREYRASWERVRDHVPLLRDPSAAYWDVVRSQEILHDELRPADRLALGWRERFAGAPRFLNDALPALAGALPSGLVLNDSASRLLWGALAEHGITVQAAMDEIDRALQEHGDEFFTWEKAASELHEAIRNAGVSSELAGVPIAALECWVSSGERTHAGGRLPWLDLASGCLRHIQIEPGNFRSGFDPRDYWKQMKRMPPLHWGAILGGRDVPFDPRVEPTVPLPVAENVDEARKTTRALLDEAVAMKKWSVPPGAVIELPVGPFAYAEVSEIDDNYFFVFRTSDNDFAVGVCEPKAAYVSFGGVSVEREADQRIHAAAELLMAAAVRDFLVVEERERVFAHRTERRPGRYRRIPDDEPQVIYLPRVRYHTAPDPAQCAKQLEQNERRAHRVAPHLRKAAQASQHQQVLAKRYGFEVPTGYTFVRPHERGGHEREVIYRSRSALQSLYSATEATATPARPRWFQFERDVQAAMQALGFSVQHVAASRRGDQGVDVFATKGADLDLVNWVIQCKCYPPKRRVGPDTVRELIGTLSEHPRGTRGMIATTSDFSADARRTAERADIRLMPGDEFGRLSGNQ
jgi:hypothetical protein